MSSKADSQKQFLVPMIIIGSLFFIFGFITWLNSVLIPFLRQACQLTDFQAFFVTFAFYFSYFIMAIPSSVILRKTGFAKGMSVGLGVMAVGSLIFVPAAMSRSFPLFLVGLFMQGTGLTLLQTASNPYVTILGPIESAAKRISFMGMSNKLAGMVGIFILVKLLFSDTQALSAKISSLTGSELENELNLLAQRVITPYIIMASVLGLLALIILKAHLPEIDPEEEVVDDTKSTSKKTSVFQFPHLLLGVICIFAYVGVEVIAIDAIGLYGQYQNFDLKVAGTFSIYSLIALTVGYVLGIVLIPKSISQKKALQLSGLLGLLFVIGVLLTNGWASIAFVVLLSFAHAFMWPAIWPLAIDGLGRFTKIASALMIMGVVGGALVPLLYGAVADAANRQIAYVVAIPCYAYIVFYATRGHLIGKGAVK